MKSVDKYLDNNGLVNTWPKKHADKQIVCEYLSTKFEFVMAYHEREVNEIIKAWHTFTDWPLLRREMIERNCLNVILTELNTLGFTD